MLCPHLRSLHNMARLWKLTIQRNHLTGKVEAANIHYSSLKCKGLCPSIHPLSSFIPQHVSCSLWPLLQYPQTHHHCTSSFRSICLHNTETLTWTSLTASTNCACVCGDESVMTGQTSLRLGDHLA